MINKEKVLKGLECCLHSSKSHCDECPYIYESLCNINYCTADLASDALALLKENPDIVDHATIKEPDCRICAQSHCRYYHESQKPTECKSYIRKEDW